MRLSRCFEGFHRFFHLIRHIKHFLKEIGALAGNIYFPVTRIGEESGLQVIVLLSAERVYVRISAVMVGDKQTLLRYHASRAAEVQRDDSILEGHFAFVVNLSRGQFKPGFLHLLHQSFGQRIHHPHAFVG